ncbi:MAG: hypothetical protein DRH15_15665 [Deltaproteobacteria bacterium]|nr:MAG: hypothetical protein DRH15_15665 [Deltaproteobacteria bacterium]
MKIELKITLKIPNKLRDVNSIEEFVFRERNKIGKMIFVKILKKIEEKRLNNLKKATKLGEFSCYLYTRLGIIRIARWRIKFKEKTYYLLDKVINLNPLKATNYILKRAAELASDYTYRKASSLLSKEISDYFGKDLIWYWIKRIAKVLEAKENLRTQSILNNQNLSSQSPHPKAIIEIDATSIHKQYKGKPTKENLEVKLAICYTDIKKKNKKNYLENKIIYAGVEDTNTFGNNLYSLLEDKLNITSIKDKLLIGDGDRWIKEIKNLHFPDAKYHLDWWHLTKNIRKAMRENKRLNALFLKYLYEGRAERIIDTLATKYRALTKEKQEINNLLEYLKNNKEGIYGSKDFEINKVGSGAIEKNIEIMIGRRFKKQGMSWSKEGAQALLKLRVLKQNKEDWDKFFEELKWN